MPPRSDVLKPQNDEANNGSSVDYADLLAEAQQPEVAPTQPPVETARPSADVEPPIAEAAPESAEVQPATLASGRINALQQALAEARAANPDDYFESSRAERVLTDQLAQLQREPQLEDATDEDLESYLDTIIVVLDRTKTQRPLEVVAGSLTPDQMVRLYEGENGQMKKLIEEDLEDPRWGTKLAAARSAAHWAELGGAAMGAPVSAWQSPEVRSIDPLVDKIASTPDNFADLCLLNALEPYKLDGLTETDRASYLHDQEAVIFDVLGLEKSLSERVSRAIAERSEVKDSWKKVEDGAGEKIVGTFSQESWTKSMDRIIKNVSEIGPDAAKDLSNEFGIVSFDIFEATQLDRMKRLLAKDPELIRLLQDNDVTLFVVDGDGDRYQSEIPTSKVLESPTTLIGEVHADEVSNIVRIPVKLQQRYGVQPSNIIYQGHGTTGMTGVGSIRGPQHIVTTGEAPTTKPEKGPSITSLSEIMTLGQMADRLMKPSAKTNERTIIINSCKQADETNGVQSIARSLADASDPSSNLRVVASVENINITSTSEGMLHFVSEGEPVEAITFRPGQEPEHSADFALSTIPQPRRPSAPVQPDQFAGL